MHRLEVFSPSVFKGPAFVGAFVSAVSSTRFEDLVPVLTRIVNQFVCVVICSKGTCRRHWSAVIRPRILSGILPAPSSGRVPSGAEDVDSFDLS